MNELFLEIEEDIKRERLDKLWHHFGKVMIGVSIAVVLVTVGVVIVQDHRQSQAMEKTSEIMKGINRLNIEDFKGAIPLFTTLAQDDSSSYYGLAMLRKAQAEAALGDQAAAQKTYQALSKHDAVFGGLAQLMVSPAPGNVIEPQKNSPFYFTQSEWKGWQLMQQGKKEEAITQFLALYNDPEAPSSMHERMNEILQHIAPEKIAVKEDKQDDQPKKKLSVL